MSINHPGVLKNLEVKIDITHPYISDLLVTLISPKGTRIILHNQIGDAQDNIIKSYNTSTAPELEKLVGEFIKGDWHLNVADLAAEDVGKFNCCVKREQ